MTTPSTRPTETDPASPASRSPHETEAAFHAARLVAYRDDGPIAHLLGGLSRGQLPPLPPILVAAVVSAILLVAGVAGYDGPALLAPALVLLPAGAGSAHPHTGRLDWTVPVIIRIIEYGYLAAVGFAHGVPKPLAFALLGVLTFHHYDTAYRTRQRLWPAAWVFRAGLGWDGRMLIAGAGALAHNATLVYALLTGYLAIVFAAESIHSRRRGSRHTGVAVDLEDDEVVDPAPPVFDGGRTGRTESTR